MGLGGCSSGSNDNERPSAADAPTGPDAASVGQAGATEPTPPVAADSATTHTFTGTAGFETGLVKLVTIDGRLKSKNDVTVNWGDRVSTGALFANCGGLEQRRNCEIWGTHLYNQPGTYAVGVTFTLEKILPRNEVPQTETATAQIAGIGNYVVVAVGDSYYSGEGSPRHSLLELDTALWDEPAFNYFNGSLGPAVDSNGTEFVGDDGIKTCHRSSLSGPLLAAETVRQHASSLTFIHMACSGAKLGRGSREVTPGSSTRVRDTGDFINEQLDWIRTRVPRIDALLVSAGGNNVGFADTIAACLCLGLDPGLDACPVLMDKGYCSTDPAVRLRINEDFKDLRGFTVGDGPNVGKYVKGHYDRFAEDIKCRTTAPGGGAQIGTLCAGTQWRASAPIMADGVSIELIDASYGSQTGDQTVTVDGTMTATGGCHHFTLDAADVSAPTLELTKVDKSDALCGVYETAFSKTEPFGEILYMRGSFDGWHRVPDWSQRFVNMGDGTLQAEFVLPGTADEPHNWKFKVASMEEMQIPGVTLINHYPDVTRNGDGETPTALQTLECTLWGIAPSEWDFLKEQLVDRLTDAIDDKAQEFDWRTITVPEFRTRGYCSNLLRTWMVRAQQAPAIQGDFAGTAHPNWAGHRHYADQIYAQLRVQNPPRTVAHAASGESDYEFGSVTTEDVVVSLSASNPLADAGVAATYYAIGKPYCTAETLELGTCMPYQSPFTVSESGIHEVSFLSTNLAGEAETRVWPVTVFIDKEGPEMTCEAAPAEPWPPNGKLVDVEVTVTAIDAVSGPAGFTLAAIDDSEMNAAKDVVGFEIGASDTNGQVRVGRLGTGPGRTYTFTYESADAFGNVSECEASVNVPHDQGMNDGG